MMQMATKLKVTKSRGCQTNIINGIWKEWDKEQSVTD
jgi:hypothetical protein